MADVTVSIATYNTPPEMLRRAIESVLAQTYANWSLVIVNDHGDREMLVDATSDLLEWNVTIVETPSNVGRYAIDHEIVGACQTTFWAPLDSDDWAEPTWLERMMERSTVADVVFCDHLIHRPNGRVVEERVKHWDGTDRLVWHAHLSSLWRVEWMREQGITTPNMRIAWDTVMTSVPWLLGRVKLIEEPLVHRQMRPDSLTQATTTGHRSIARTHARRVCEKVWADIVDSPAECSNIVANMAGIQMRHSSAAMIRGAKDDGWVLTREALAELDRRLWQLQPRTILECGSGESTRILANYAAHTGAKVVTLEHLNGYHRRTLSLLNGLRGVVDVRLCKLEGAPPFYGTNLPDNIDFALIDGPPESTGGRAGVLPAIAPHLSTGYEIWFDDADREYRAVIDQVKMLPGHAAWFPTSIPRGLYVISNMMHRSPLDATDVAVTILTGARPDLMTRTFLSLPSSLLETADSVTCMVNGNDDETLAAFDDLQLPGEILTTPTMIPAGEAIAGLAQQAHNSRFWLHLEDDWEYLTVDDTWLDGARDALDSDPEIAQVRLRHLSDVTLQRNQVTNLPIRWSTHRYGLVCDDSHLTWNPSLVRSEMAALFPTRSERTFQEEARHKGWRKVVQMAPGCWTHIGDGRSLREVTGG